ncbi:MAG: uroporphyrinogen-III C-methyltransferase [Gammaproteobacteria bacterium]|nr:uroporphyrinogen-III C-methyltransferase [Gammaproteobacteria bacterium]
MDQLPIFVCLKGQRCLVVGGGEVAERKVRQLLTTGATVTVNSPQLNRGLQQLGDSQRITAALRPFDATLIDTHLLVIAATSDRAVNHAVAAAAHKSLRLCNVVDDPALSSFISPSIVDRSPLIVAISSGGRAPVLARMLRQQLERWLPLRLGELAAWAGEWRDTIKARLPDIAARRLFWERAFSGTLSGHVLAGRMQAADDALQGALKAQVDAGDASGEAWLVGAGPGDPELLSLRGFHLLQHADVVLHDRLVAAELLAFARRDAELINVGKTGGGPGTSQAEINALLLARVRAGKRVCRLKGGDPYVFGRGSEEADVLARAGLRFQVIPGITAANGCGAYAGIPLTHRGLAQAVTFVTGHLAPDSADAGNDLDWAALAALKQTLVIYMGGRKLAVIAAELMAHGRTGETPAAVVIAGTTPEQRIITGTLADIAQRGADADPGLPALLYVGEVVRLAEHLGRQTPTAGTARPSLELRPGDLQ